MKFSIRLLYLYLFSFIGLLVSVIGAIRLVDLGLKVYVFQNADQYIYVTPLMPESADGKVRPVSPEIEKQQRDQQIAENNRQRKRTTAEALSMILVGTPLYLYHWKTIKKEN